MSGEGTFDVSQEITHAEKLDLAKYGQWRDYLYKLQIAETSLPGETKEQSELIGHYGRCIGQATILGLAERSQSIAGKFNGIATIDSVPDEQVLLEASVEDKTKYFLEAVLAQAKMRGIEDMQERAIGYAIAAITIGHAVLGDNEQAIKQYLISAFDKSDVGAELISAIKVAISNTQPSRIQKLIEYLKFSQSQLNQTDEYALRRKFAPTQPLGSTPLQIDGHEYVFGGDDRNGEYPVYLTDEDTQTLVPLLGAVHRGRADMVEQAREIAYSIFDVERGSLEKRNPPSWWLNGEDLERLHDDEILVYCPPQTNLNSSPPMFKTLYEDPEFMPGWNILKVSKEFGVITEIRKLVS